MTAELEGLREPRLTKLKGWVRKVTTDRHGRPLDDNSAPMHSVTCGDLRLLLGRVEAAEAKLAEAMQKSTPEGRFWAKVNKIEDGCWEWTGAVHGSMGYGKFSVKVDGHWRDVNAHRWLYEHLNGPQPRYSHICHACDNPLCVRPDHLFAGSRSDNMQDCARKGRNGMQRHPEKNPFLGRRDIQQGRRKLAGETEDV